MRLGQARPRIIRRITKTDAKGRPKIARDRKILVQMERIVARTNHQCTYLRCPNNQLIESGTEYAKVTRMDSPKRMGNRYVPDSRVYHFDCVPSDTRPLVRFLVPQQWAMVMCTGENGELLKRMFTSVEAWRLWLAKDHPVLMRKDAFAFENNNMLQHGTGYYWSTLVHVSRNRD